MVKDLMTHLLWRNSSICKTFFNARRHTQTISTRISHVIGITCYCSTQVFCKNWCSSVQCMLQTLHHLHKDKGTSESLLLDMHAVSVQESKFSLLLLLAQINCITFKSTTIQISTFQTKPKTRLLLPWERDHYCLKPPGYSVKS